MAAWTYRVQFSGTAEIVVNDDRVIRRITENRDANDVPQGQPGWDETTAYRTTLYRMNSPEQVLEMLLWNAAANGVRQANRLDGWADLADDAAEVDVQSVEVDYVELT